MGINNIRVFVGLPVICKKIMTVEIRELKNHEEFEVINLDYCESNSQIKNDRLVFCIKHDDFTSFDMYHGSCQSRKYMRLSI